MARKFSLKDNPIFQRLQIPKLSNSDILKDNESSIHYEEANEELTTSSEREIHERTTFRPSNLDPQKIPPTQERSLFPVNFSSVTNAQDQGKEVSHPAESLESQFVVGDEGQNLTLKNFTSSHNQPLSTINTERAHLDFNEKRKQAEYDSYTHSGSVESSSERGNGAEFDPQILTLKTQSTEKATTDDESSHLVEPQKLGAFPDSPLSNELLHGIDKSLFFSFYNEMNDELLPQLDAAEQILYSRLFRLSYGFNRTYCTVSQPVLKEKTGLSRNTIRTGLQMLVQKEWVRIIDSGNHVSTTYRVILPREKNGRSILDPQNLSLKKRRSEKYPQNLRRNSGSSKIAPPVAQKKDLQKLTLKDKKKGILSEFRALSKAGSNLEAQKKGPLTITNTLLTLTQKESPFSDLGNSSYNHSANLLITLFYKKLEQEPSSAKWKKGMLECRQLLQDGFSEEQIEYGINWLLAHHPGTGSFSRVAHFIDQALKEKEKEQQESLLQQKRRLSEEDERLKAKHSIEESRQIEDIKASLATEALAVLREEAIQCVDSEHGTPKYGRETLIQIKLNELIRVRFLYSSIE